MKKIVAQSILIFLGLSACQAYQRKELLFERGIPRIPRYEIKTDGTRSAVEVVNGPAEFQNQVLKNKVPVVVHVHLDRAGYTEKLMNTCHQVAQSYKRARKAIKFISLNANRNKKILQFIGAKLHLAQLDLPALIFFHQGTISLPVISGYVNQQRLSEEIQRRFFSNTSVQSLKRRGL